MAILTQEAQYNGKTITFPAGYASVEDYISVCKLNVKTLENTKISKNATKERMRLDLLAKYNEILSNL